MGDFGHPPPLDTEKGTNGIGDDLPGIHPLFRGRGDHEIEIRRGYAGKIAGVGKETPGSADIGRNSLASLQTMEEGHGSMVAEGKRSARRHPARGVRKGAATEKGRNDRPGPAASVSGSFPVSRVV